MEIHDNIKNSPASVIEISLTDYFQNLKSKKKIPTGFLDLDYKSLIDIQTINWNLK